MDETCLQSACTYYDMYLCACRAMRSGAYIALCNVAWGVYEEFHVHIRTASAEINVGRA